MSEDSSQSETPERSEDRPPRMTAEESLIWDKMTEEARKELQGIDLNLRPFPTAELMWHRLLTPEQQRDLGDDCAAAYRSFGTLGMWMRANKFTNRFAALAELADAIWSRDWVVKQSGANLRGQRPALGVPDWNPETGELTFAGKRIRTIVRRFRHKSHVQLILTAFQAAGWRSTIPNPLENPDQTTLHQAVHKLNKTLSIIGFSAGNGATTVSWRLAEATDKSSQSHRE